MKTIKIVPAESLLILKTFPSLGKSSLGVTSTFSCKGNNEEEIYELVGKIIELHPIRNEGVYGRILFQNNEKRCFNYFMEGKHFKGTLFDKNHVL